MSLHGLAGLLATAVAALLSLWWVLRAMASEAASRRQHSLVLARLELDRVQTDVAAKLARDIQALADRTARLESRNFGVR